MEPLTISVALVLKLIALFVAYTVSLIVSWFSRVWGSVVHGLMAQTSMVGFHALVRAAPVQAMEWMALAVSDFMGPTTEWAGFVQGYFNQLIGYPIDIRPMLETGIGRGGRTAMEGLGETFLTPMMGLIMPGYGREGFPLGLTPQDGLDAAERFLGVNLEFQMRGWLLHLLGDTLSFGMWKAMKDLPNAISWSFGIGWLSWLVMGTPFRMGIAEPLEVLYNQLYRPYRMSLAKVADVFWRGHKDVTWFYNQMRDLGVRDPDMDIILEMERTKMTDAQAYKLYRMGKLTAQDVEDHHRAQGHSPTDSYLLYVEMVRRETRDLLENIAKTAMKHYKDRRMSAKELYAFLREGGWTDNEAFLIKQDLDMQIALEPPEVAPEKVLSPAKIGWLYQHERRTRLWAETKLIERGFRTDEIGDFLETYEPKEEKPPVPREPPTGLIGTVYQRGLIGLDTAKSLWRRLMLTEDYINLLAMRYAPPVPPPPPPPREFNPAQVGQLYQEREITRENAMSRLMAPPILFSRSNAAMFLDAFYEPIEEVVPPPKEVPAYVVGGLYKQGLETEAVFRSYLVELRYSDRAVEWLLSHYAPPVPPPPLPPKEFRPSEIGKLWRDHYMTTEVALERLTGPKIRMTEDDAKMYLEAFYHPVEAVEPPPREAPASVVGQLYKNTQIALSDFEEHLDTLRYSPASKEFLIQLYAPPVEVPPPPLPPRELSPTVIGRLYREQSITRSEALGRLVALSPPMTTEDATVYLDTLYTPET